MAVLSPEVNRLNGIVFPVNYTREPSSYQYTYLTFQQLGEVGR